jgi:hypothetical protein
VVRIAVAETRIPSPSSSPWRTCHGGWQEQRAASGGDPTT